MAEVEESNADSDEVSIQAGDDSPGISPKFGRMNSQSKGNSNGRYGSVRSTCMGNNNHINSPFDGINVGCDNECDVQETAEHVGGLFNNVRSEKDNEFMEEREARDKVDPSDCIGELLKDGSVKENGPDGDNREFGPDGDNGEIGPDYHRPSFITIRPNQFKPKRNIGAHEFVTPDLNNAVGIEESSDPFNIDEIFRMEAVSKSKEGAISCNRIRGETEGDEFSKADGVAGIDREVAETMEVVG
ncbi:hypothetical protein Hanom_Chr08g00728471 [Helianthus anomalus]